MKLSHTLRNSLCTLVALGGLALSGPALAEDSSAALCSSVNLIFYLARTFLRRSTRGRSTRLGFRTPGAWVFTWGRDSNFASPSISCSTASGREIVILVPPISETTGPGAGIMRSEYVSISERAGGELRFKSFPRGGRWFLQDAQPPAPSCGFAARAI